MKTLQGATVAVIGLGKTGSSVTRFLCSKGAHVVVNDRGTEESLRERVEEVRSLGAVFRAGEPMLTELRKCDFIVVSPGVPLAGPLLEASLAGVPIVGEIELASWFLRSRILAVTGSNGKSTVTSWVGDMCRRGEGPVFVGGNLGTPLIDAIGTAASEEGGTVVVEVSSFQLETVASFAPNVAALLNVTPDHLDRHGTFAQYVAAKSRIFTGQLRSAFAVVPSEHPLINSLARNGDAQIATFGGRTGTVRCADDRIVDETTALSVPSSALRLQGAHNVLNACAAALIGRLAAIPTSDIEASLRAFAGLPHRMEHVRDLGGARFYNDSKGTNVGAAVAAVSGLDGKVVLIAGGKHKGSTYAPLVSTMRKKGRGIVLIGEAAELIHKELGKVSFPVVIASSMKDAVREARQIARSGDAVLLSPACSSFDMYRSYEERGDDFKREVRALEEI